MSGDIGIRTRRALRLTLVLCAAAAGLVAAARAAATELVLPASSMAGFHSRPASRQLAIADLAGGLPRKLAASVARAEVQVSSSASRTQHLRSDAFVFGSERAAADLLSAWRRARHARRVPVGAAGYESIRGRLVVVAWRDGARIGVIALEGRGARDHAVGDAALADGWLSSPLPTTRWGKVLDQIRPDGSVSKQTALEAFAVAYGHLPGVAVPPGRRTTVPSGTLADQWILSYWGRLTGAQRRFVSQRLGITGATSSAHAADNVTDPTFKPDAAIQALADKYVPIYQARLGRTLAYQVVAGTTAVSKTTSGDDFLADTLTMTAADQWGSGTPVKCRIRVSPLGQALDSHQSDEYTPPLELVVAHEVFHCFQFSIMNSWTLPDAWITEGMADWAALTVDPVPYFNGGGNLQTYITTPHTQLFKRTYDAVGFWGHSEDTFDLWGAIPGILNAGSNESAFHLAAGDTDGFLTSWGSSVFRLGVDPWQMHSPIDPPGFVQEHSAVQKADLLSMPFMPVDAEPLTTSQYKISGGPKEPLVHVQIDGHARLSQYGNYTDLKDAWFCMGPAPCVCPPDTQGQVPPTMPLGNVSAFPLALSGDPGTGTHGLLSSVPLSDFCTPNQPPPPSNGGTGGSFGDPYITTFDGSGAIGTMPYGFQTTGEFTLVKSTVDNLEIQARLQPFTAQAELGFAGDLAMNTAFAMRDGGATVEVDNTTPGIGQPGALVLYVDRQRADLRSAQSLALTGGGRVRYTPSDVTVTWPDGTVADVERLLYHFGVNISVKPSRQRAGRLTGLLGNDDHNPNNDYVGRDGRSYSAKVVQGFDVYKSSEVIRHIVLDEFGASWRITPATSLFVYPPGKNTYSYIVKGFPHRAISQQSLNPHQLAAAENACRRAGVTNAALLAGCVVDVGATGNRQLAASAAAFQRATGLRPGGGLSGHWSGRYSGAFNGTFSLNWEQSGSKLHGRIDLSSPRSTLPIIGNVTGDVIRFGAVGFVTYVGTVHGNSMSGTYNSPRGGGSWSATRTS